MDALEEFKQTYFQECDELLGELETHLMSLQDGSTEVETLHAAFRAIHSIKGGAGAFGLDRLVSFSHTFETVLDLMRDGKLELTEDLVATTVRAGDIVADLVAAARGAEDPAAGFESEVLAALSAIAGNDEQPAPEEAAADFDIDFTPIPVDLDSDDGAKTDDDAETEVEIEAPSVGLYRIHFRPTKEMFTRAHEPLNFVRELKALGALTVTADTSGLPEFADLDPEAAYIAWDFELETSAGLETVEEVFEFVVDDCTLKIEPPDVAPPSDRATDRPPEPEPDATSQADSEPADTAVPPATETPAASNPLEVGDEPTDQSIGESSAAEPTARAEPSEAPGPLAEPASVAKVAAPAAQAKPPTAQQSRTAGVTAIRVDLDKIDRLVNMVGELVITQAMISQQSDQMLSEHYPQLVQGLEQLHQHTRGLQDSVMAIRAQPVNSVFSRIPRLVRELSAQTGKKIRLEMSGEGTEIDKTVIEQLNDPLTHIIRNSADHGVESPEVREAAGKPAEGTIDLSAAQRGGRIVIQIADDGAGVNRKKVLSKAIEKNLVAADAKLSDEEIDNLIFLPGFSTADEVSNISGRGVGMDVVKQNIQKLGGRVSVRSEPGKGSSITLTLPLTLAVLDGMIIRVGVDSYVVPLTNIIESLSPRPEDFETVPGGGEMLKIRGEYVEVICLRTAFSMATDAAKELIVIVDVEGGEQIGLVVDEIVGQQQVVIKSLEDNFDPIPGIAGATILGDGNVSLILDVGGLRNARNNRPNDRDRKPKQTNRDQEKAA